MAGSATFREKVLSAVTTGTSTAYDAIGYTMYALYVDFGAGTSAGVVVIEHAPFPGYTGTWDNLGTVTWATVSTTDSFQTANRICGAVRARFTTDVVGGTADVWIVMGG